MADILIIAGYFTAALATTYVLGRIDYVEFAPFALLWPILVPVMCFIGVAHLGRKHRRGY